jgi:putative membrane protein
VHLFLTSIVPTVPAAWLALAEGVVYESYDHVDRMFGLSVTQDQQLAGLIMKLGGTIFLWTLIIVLYFRWSASQDRGSHARRVVVDERGEVISVDGPPALTYEQVADAFESAGAPRRETAG